MKQKNNFIIGICLKLKRGFSLVELLVVVSIVAILSVSSVAGFSYLGDILKAKEVTGLMADKVKQEELKILRGDFEKAAIHFYRDYLVIEQMPEDASFILELHEAGPGDCPEGVQHKLVYGNQGNLTQRDEKESILYIKNVSAGQFDCIPFKDSENIEWGYQLSDGDQFSNHIRFVHFNLQRESASHNRIYVDAGAGAFIEINAPYAKKTIYNSSGDSAGWIDISVRDENGNSEDTLTLR